MGLCPVPTKSSSNLPLRLNLFLNNPVYLEWYDMKGWQFHGTPVQQVQWMRDFLVLRFKDYSMKVSKKEIEEDIKPIQEEPKMFTDIPVWNRIKIWWYNLWA